MESQRRRMLSLDGLSVGDEDSRVDLVAVDVDGLPLLPTAVEMAFGQMTIVLRHALNVFSDLEAVRNPGMTLCSLVLVWMMESMRSSRVRSFATDGLLQGRDTRRR